MQRSKPSDIKRTSKGTPDLDMDCLMLRLAYEIFEGSGHPCMHMV
jgi:hypothetical protein